MKLSTLLFVTLASAFASPSPAAEPNLSFDLNRDGKFYSFKIENNGNIDIECKSIVITAPIGKDGCSEIASSYVYTISKKKIPKAAVILNSTFGLDYLHAMNKDSHDDGFEYCDQPQIKMNCK